MNLPFVSRRRYDLALAQIAQARLELEVERAETRHLSERRLELIKLVAKASKELAAMQKECDNWRAAYHEINGTIEVVEVV